MTRHILILTACALVCGCGKGKPASATPAWHEPWLADKLSAGAELLGEHAISPGSFHTISFPAHRSWEVGFVAKDGYELSRSRGMIYPGTAANPRLAGASTGTGQTFEPVEGKIEVRFENASPVSTRIAVWRK